MTDLKPVDLVPCPICGIPGPPDQHCINTQACRDRMRRIIRDQQAKHRRHRRHITAQEHRAEQRRAAQIFLGIDPNAGWSPTLQAYF